MSTVSGSSSYSTASFSNHGMSGLVSGLDTEGMVQGMLSGLQNKIDRQEAEKQVTIWKQLMYRDVISQITSFQNTFFGNTSSNSLFSESFYNSMFAAVESKAFSVIASSSAAVGKTNVKVGQVATSSKVQSGSQVSGTMSGQIDKAALDRVIVLSDSKGEYRIDLNQFSTTKPDGTQMNQKEATEALKDALNQQFKSAGIDDAKAEIDDKTGKLKISGVDLKVSAKSSKLGMEMLGVEAGQSISQKGRLFSTVPDAVPTFSMKLNGITKTIKLDNLQPGAQEADIAKALQEKIDNAFGKGWVDVKNDGGRLTMTSVGNGNVFTVGGNKSGLTLLGLKDGQSNKINGNQMLRDTGFATALQGDKFSFSINGESFSFTGENTVNDVMRAINSSAAGVRVTYSEIADKFTIESSDTGAGTSIKMEQTEGNLLNAMFGSSVKTGSSFSGKSMVTDSLQGSKDFGVGAKVKKGRFDITINGEKYSISVPAKDGDAEYTHDEMMKIINEGLAERQGYMDDGKQAIELVKRDDGSFGLEVRNGAKVSFSNVLSGSSETPEDQNKELDKAAEMGNLAAAFGFNNTDNAVKDDKVSLKSVGITGNGSITIGSQKIDYSENDTIESLLQKINGTSLGQIATFDNGKIQLSSKSQVDITITGKLTETMGEKISLNGASGEAEAVVTEGQNAIVEINGEVIQRSSNSFTVNGMTFSLNDTTGKITNDRLTQTADGWTDADGHKYTVVDGVLKGEGDTGKYHGQKIDSNGYVGDIQIDGTDEVVNVTRDTEKIFEGVKKFVEEYNKLIENLNKLTDAEPTYKKYPPLTEAQKKEMSEREIELWEEKAKEGLLRKEENITALLGSMRSILYSKPEGGKYALYELGIDTSTDWKEKGKLVLDEAKLKSMIESEPQALQELFTSPNGGLAKRMNDALNEAASTNSGKPGSLVAMAGIDGKASSVSNTLTKRLISINEKIKTLQAKYEKDRARYWKKFNAMEVQLSNMNTQSNWLMQQFM